MTCSVYGILQIFFIYFVDKPTMPTLLKTVKKPYRLGLSKRQKLPSLHPKMERI